MAVKLRLMRLGKKGKPAYRVCAIDSRKPRNGQYIESIGVYDPHVADDLKKVRIDRERAEYWLGVGATPSETVLSFLRKAQVSGLLRTKKAKHQRPKKPAKRPTTEKAVARVERRVAKRKKAAALKAKAAKQAKD